MSMIQYPKVPRHGLPFVVDEFFSGDVFVTEKTDGSLIRFTVFDSRYESFYTEDVMRMNPVDGSVIVATSGQVQWVVHPDGTIAGSVNGAYTDVLHELRDISIPDVMSIHEYSECPVVWFAEGMVGHLVEYDDDTPPLVGFDAYVPWNTGRETIGQPSEWVDENPYDFRWYGFCDTDVTMGLFEQIGIRPIHYADELIRLDGSEIDVESFVPPLSQFGDVQAEGVVFRNDKVKQRVKLRSQVYREIEQHHHEEDSSGDNPPTQRFIAAYCTRVRIMKTAMKMVYEEDYELEMSMTSELSDRVYTDIWQEEWRTIKDLSYDLPLPEIRARVTRRCADVLRDMIAADDVALVLPNQVVDEATVSFR